MNLDEHSPEPSEIVVRAATVADAQGVLEAHFAAVHSAAAHYPAKFYDDETLDDWSPIVDEQRVQNFLATWKPDQEVMHVACLDDFVCGFASIYVPSSELRACYVHPEATGLGVGGRLLSSLEGAARELKLGWLTLDASLNAENFYNAMGYQSDGIARHLLPTGRHMNCVRMYKFL
ncbi:MAG: GNAT family N-acetyltransferase [Candidatus Obscuribacter sp.]|nr:GNAT family N-acetyltransferase [Candidatus Obscuribacter sp.]